MTGAPLLTQLEPLHPEAWGWALHCCAGDPHAAEEALQGAYLRVAQCRAEFCGKSALKTWWLGVVRLVALEQRRRAWWRLERLREWYAASGPAGGVTKESDEAPDGALGLALGQLPARQREVLHLVFYQDLSVSDAAVAMGVSVGSARQHYERAKTRLRSLLANHERA